jgi:hypothetical protein|tara:strand:+ start:614 stop:1015 length:402 start_codon:yes stop_codon:yes gene_type:complete
MDKALKDINKLREMFEGKDIDSVADLNKLEKRLKLARMKKSFKQSDAAKMVIVWIADQIALCNTILKNDRGLDKDGNERDHIVEKVFRARIFERLDTYKMFMSFFGGKEEEQLILNKIEREKANNKTFLDEMN